MTVFEWSQKKGLFARSSTCIIKKSLNYYKKLQMYKLCDELLFSIDYQLKPRLIKNYINSVPCLKLRVQHVPMFELLAINCVLSNLS